jgi:hypothetical protein
MKSLKNIDVQGVVIRSACVGGGAYASVKMNRIKFIGKQKPALRGAIKIALGAFAPVLAVAFAGKKLKGNEKIITSVGDGIIAGGAIELAGAFDKGIATDLSNLTTTISGLDTMGAMGEVVFDESYTSGVGATNDVMGAADDDGGYTIEM